MTRNGQETSLAPGQRKYRESQRRADIGNRIRKLRERLSIAQKDLAEEMDIPRAHLSMMEHGRKNTSLDMLIRMAERFEVSLDYIITGKLK